MWNWTGKTLNTIVLAGSEQNDNMIFNIAATITLFVAAFNVPLMRLYIKVEENNINGHFFLLVQQVVWYVKSYPSCNQHN